MTLQTFCLMEGGLRVHHEDGERTGTADLTGRHACVKSPCSVNVVLRVLVECVQLMRRLVRAFARQGQCPLLGTNVYTSIGVFNGVLMLLSG
jgi:hypothetical protein